MAVYKEEKTNTWRVIYRYTDWNGERKQSQKRGFKTKREAQAWEREQLNKLGGDLDMNFKSLGVRTNSWTLLFQISPRLCLYSIGLK